MSTPLLAPDPGGVAFQRALDEVIAERRAAHAAEKERIVVDFIRSKGGIDNAIASVKETHDSLEGGWVKNVHATLLDMLIRRRDG